MNSCIVCKGDLENKNTNFIADLGNCIIIIVFFHIAHLLIICNLYIFYISLIYIVFIIHHITNIVYPFMSIFPKK